MSGAETLRGAGGGAASDRYDRTRQTHRVGEADA